MEIKLIIISNFLNPHQYPLSQELYKLTDGGFRFIELEKIPDTFVKSGYPEYDNVPWLIRAWESESNQKEVEELVINTPTMIAGGCAAVEKYIGKRLKHNKLTLKYSERWLKRGIINVLSPNIFRPIISYWLHFRNKPYYLLCASAFTSSDSSKFGTFKNKAFKWGYFPATDGVKDNESNYSVFHDGTGVFKIMTVCRMLNWKRPEMMIEAAKYLRDNDVKFIMDMYGSGERLNLVKQLIDRYNLNNNVVLHGNIPNEKIHEEMKHHHCLLFTSNQREGWGAVVNEAMANGCVVVGASKIGSIPYLIKDGMNGVVFEDGNQDDLNKKLHYCAIHITECESLAKEARNTISTVWSPNEAAKRLLVLADALNNKKKTPYKDGPCSLAPLL